MATKTDIKTTDWRPEKLKKYCEEFKWYAKWDLDISYEHFYSKDTWKGKRNQLEEKHKTKKRKITK